MTNKGGRPKIDINWKLVNNMCAIMCTQDEIASVLGVSTDTLNRRIKEEYGLGFADYYKKESSSGKMSLRRMQFNRAMGDRKTKADSDGNIVETNEWANNGSVTMLIWLGKQWLNQTDKTQVDLDAEVELSEVATALMGSYSSSDSVSEG